MSTFPTHTFRDQAVKFRFGERYISEATNRKCLGFPPGVYFGFVPTLVENILTLAPDLAMGLSLARLISQDDALAALDVISDSNIVIDFTGHTVYPVNVVLKANGTLGQPFSAEIVTQAAAPALPTELLLGVMISSGSFDSDLPSNRSNPFAYVGAHLGYGFMPSSSVEELLAAVSMITEVQDARIDLDGVTQANLKDRLDVDAAGPAIASRLGQEIRTIISEDYTLAAGTGVVVVGDSFANKHRTNSPIETIPGFGSETKIGAVTDGTPRPFPPAGTLADDDRNVCAVIDIGTERRLLDSNRRPIYCRLSLDEVGLTGQLDFVATSPTVNGIGTSFISQIEAGDIIEDGAGDFYEVAATPSSNTVLTLSIPATNTNSTTTSIRRRFTISYFIRADATTDTPVTVPLGTAFRFFFPMWDTLEFSQWDYVPELFKNFDGEPVVNATTAIAGKVQLENGAIDATAGTIWRILDSGNVVGDGNIHSLNFGAVADAGLGAVNVTSRGLTGDQGAPAPPGIPGPAGPKGPIGVGYSTYGVPFATDFRRTVGPVGPIHPGESYSFTYTFTGLSELLFVSGGMYRWEPYGNGGSSTVDITNIVKLNANTARITLIAPTGDASFRFGLFLNAAGY